MFVLEVKGSFLSVDGTLLHQSVVINPDGIFHNGSKGDGLVGALAKLLNLRDQFHHLIREANTELLWSIRMLSCHDCWG